MMSIQISEVAPVEFVVIFFGINGLALAVGGLLAYFIGGYLFELGISGHTIILWLSFGVIGLLSTIFMLHYHRREFNSLPALMNKRRINIKLKA